MHTFGGGNPPVRSESASQGAADLAPNTLSGDSKAVVAGSNGFHSEVANREPGKQDDPAGAAEDRIAAASKGERTERSTIWSAPTESASRWPQFRELFETAPDGYLITDAAGTVQEANQAAALLLGIPKLYLIRKPLAALVDLEDRHTFRSTLHRAIRSKQAVEWQGRMRRNHYESFDAGITVSALQPEPCEGAGSLFLLCVLRDLKRSKQEEEMLRYQALALASALSAFAVKPELEKFLQQLLCIISDHLKTTEIDLWLHDTTTGAWSLHHQPDALSLHLIRQYYAHLRVFEGTFWDELLQKRQAIIISDVKRDARIADPSPWITASVRSVVLIPLLLGEEVIGLVRACCNRPRVYRLDELQLVQALAEQAALALQMARIAEQQQRAMVLQERNRIAQEIHDTLAQGFTGITLQLEAAEDLLQNSPQKALFHLRRARDLARHSLAEARRSVHALRPQLLEDRDLTDALTAMIEQSAAGNAADIRLETLGAAHLLASEVEDNLLRIAQEAIANALRHGRADHIQVKLVFHKEAVTLEISDDGCGFDPADSSLPYGLGLSGMRERAEHIGGKLQIHSAPGQGTQVSVLVPYLTLS